VHVHDAVAAGRFAHHGGRLVEARSLFPQAQQPWVDLSTGINRRSYPAPRATSVARNRLPEPMQLVELEETAAEAFEIDDPARVVAVAGTELALRLLPHALELREAAVLGPTYSSHADAWARASSNVRRVTDTTLHSCLDRPLALTVVNPNNPDGRALPRERLLELHDSLANHGGALIVDEAFADTDPSISVSAIAGGPRASRMIVLRSFGKFYGLAGIRLGFIIAAPSIARSVRTLIGEWPLSADALAAGRAAYADHEWSARMRVLLNRSASRLDALLRRSGFEIVGGTSLYRLVRSADARRRFLQLLQAGVLVRPFDHDETLLRFGVPHGRSEWERLAAVCGDRRD
jgi:cobalamin biosynthetic protein CobC